jgi:endonuclease YncB( thermonuclease family)
VITTLLAACQRASTPSPQPSTTYTPLPSTVTATLPIRPEAGLPPTQTASPTGAAYGLSAGTRAPSPTITPSITPDPFACLPKRPADETARVQWVTDGDTIVVALPGGLKSVRYLGIDAPAYLPNIRFYGPPAYQHNRQLVEDQVVSLYRDGPDTDALGQLLRYVVARGTFVNLELVRLGFARIDPAIESSSSGEASGSASTRAFLACAENLRQAEQAARAVQMGLWSEPLIGSALTAQAPLSATPPRPTGTLQPPLTARPSATALIQVTQPIPATATHTLGASTPSLTPSPAPSHTAGPTVTGTPPTPTHTIAPTATRTGFVPTATNTVAATQSTPSDVHITEISFEGTINLQERDEYVQITNEGSNPVDMTGWRLVKKDSDISFIFPDFTIQPGVSCSVYTNQVDAYSCVNDAFRYSYGIWDDPSGCAQLYDASNTLQQEFCYGDTNP